MSEDLTHLVNAHSSNAKRVEEWRSELDEYLNMMQDWSHTDPGTVMEEISSIAARLIQIRCDVVRSESRAMQGFRTKELDPVLAQVEFQFKLHSRRLSSLTLDWETSRGQAT
jgi:hypothetical protein